MRHPDVPDMKPERDDPPSPMWVTVLGVALPIAVMSLLAAVAACTAADFAAFGLAAAPISSAVAAVAPVVDHALGAYADAARDAQRQADLAPTSPDALALRSALARLAEAEARVAAAQLPVACVEPAGTVTPAAAVDVDALAVAIDSRIAAQLDAREQLVRVSRKRRVKDAGTEGGL